MLATTIPPPAATFEKPGRRREHVAGVQVAPLNLVHGVVVPCFDRQVDRVRSEDKVPAPELVEPVDRRRDELPGVEIDTLEHDALDFVVERRGHEAIVADRHVAEPVIEFDTGSQPSPLLDVVPTDGPVVGEVGHGAPRVVGREHVEGVRAVDR